MKRILFLLGLAALGAWQVQARNMVLGVDAFNRAVPVSSTGAAVFSPASFEIDSVIFAEAVDPIRRSRFSNLLKVMDEFEAEYRPLARMPFEQPNTNGFGLVWAHALVVDEPRAVDPSFRVTIQDLYGVEVCRARYPLGMEAWIRTRFAGDFDGWRLPPLPSKGTFSLQDIVSVAATVAPSNGWKRIYPTHHLYRVPLVGGPDLYAIVPKPGRSLSSVRARMTSATIPQMFSVTAALDNPQVPVKLSLPEVDIVSTNEMTGAFSYFQMPTAALKPFPPGVRPTSLRQTIRFRLRNEQKLPDAERLEGPFLFFIHDPDSKSLPVVGIIPGADAHP